MIKPIILTGYMGAGKTTIGRLLAEQEGLVFLDTDAVIEEREGRSIQDIFAGAGEQSFRDMETALVGELLEKGLSDTVLSVGGGLPVRAENRRILKALGTVIYLSASAETIIKRVSGSENRPLLKGGELADKVNRMLSERGPLYEQGADIIVETDGSTAPEIVREIKKRLKNIMF